MTYAAGTLTSSTPAQGFVSAISADMVAAGWTQVESALVVSTFTWRVLKSPGTSNDCGNDFHIALGYDTSSGTTLSYCAFEGWNTSTKNVSNYCPNTASLTPGTGGVNPGGPIALPPTGTAIFNRQATLAVNDQYAYTVTIDRIIFTIWAASTAKTTQYIGLYDSFLSATDDPVPLIHVPINANGSTNAADYNGTFNVANATNPVGSASREPASQGAATGNFAAGIVTALGVSSVFPAWTLSPLGNEVYTQRPMVARVPVWGRSTSGLRGLFKGLFYVPTSPDQAVGGVVEWSFQGTTYRATRARHGTNIWNYACAYYMEQA